MDSYYLTLIALCLALAGMWSMQMTRSFAQLKEPSQPDAFVQLLIDDRESEVTALHPHIIFHRR